MSDAARTLLPGATLGVLGAGQLGRMFAMAASRMGYHVHVYAPDAKDAPAAAHAERTFTASWTDEASLTAFAGTCDAVTLEFENVPIAALDVVARYAPVRPGRRALTVAQDRLEEKRFLASIGVPLGDWRPVHDEAQAADAFAQLGRPAILKTARLGYDGKGQRRVASEAEAQTAWRDLGSVLCVLEAHLDLAAEVAVVVARTVDGRLVRHPVVRTEHVHGILDVASVPADLPAEVLDAAGQAACTVAEELDLVGVTCLECFVTSDGKLLANEVAPRPHNSAHLTIEAAHTSQFEQQVRTLAGLPLGDPSLVAPAAMANLLGQHLPAPDDPRGYPRALARAGVALHLYGKRDARDGRKMGHVTVLADDAFTARRRVLDARTALRTPGS